MHVVVALEGMYPFGGTERQAVDIACGMTTRGYEVTLLSRWPLDTRSVYLDELRTAGVRILPRGWTSAPRHRRAHVVVTRAVSFGRVSTLRRHAWRWEVSRLREVAATGPTLVHEVPFFGDVSAHGIAAHERLRLPVVQTIFGTPAVPVQVAAPWAIVTSDGAPQLDPAGRQLEWVPSMGPPAPAMPVHGPAIDGRWLGVFVGRFVSAKGIDALIRAWARLPEAPTLRLIGDGPAMPELVDLVASVRANVNFTGALGRSEVLGELQRAHFLVAPSLSDPSVGSEGVPTVLAEAMWAGIPVVSTRGGGVGRLFEDEQPGWLVDSGDDGQLLAALMSATRAVDYVPAAHAAHRVFERLLSPSAVLDRYESAYDRAVSRRERLGAVKTLPARMKRFASVD
jgi:glycosyltransferase involved in cell wall biosynthesis